MDNKKIDLLMKKIADAELVLIGIGEEWGINQSDWKETMAYQQYVGKLGEESQWLPFIKKMLIEKASVKNINVKNEFYRKLLKLVENKNFFIVSLCTDGIIKKAGFDNGRIVEPCGSYKQLQCSIKCTSDLYETDDELLRKIGRVCESDFSEDDIKPVLCPNCGNPLVFNNVDLGSNYVEEGYLEQWQIYTRWLQGTVNRNVCILELGVGLKFPTVIRWPFEKVTFFNQKASLFRVHSRLFQTTEEIKERSYGIEASPEEFLKELSYRI